MKEIDVQELKKMQDSNEDFQFIDVREPYEYDEDNLNAELIPLGDIMNKKDRLSKDKKVVVHCRSGARSGSAVQMLEREGYDNLYNLKGGILAYREQIG
jgi:sulfur-carrier protein adenylyltransferase/sulfurtransferase